ncbi:MAG TPA: winged helix-turn-helix domain-containing protein [Thermoanaerobaculia bacterium]|nr:winged helix-turn-helix domain-containing protein [Thermoanaerobaculia bacterium]
MISPLSSDAGGSGPSRLLFDDFELRLDSGELFDAGSPVKLQPQPAKVLEIIASRPGEVVSREEIRQLVWGESFLDFDASLNFCVKEIRRALGDSATSPRFIETVPRRGYRFLRPVRTEAGGPALPLPVPRPWSRRGAISVTAGLLILLTFVIGSRLRPASPDPRLAVLPMDCRGGNPADRQVCGGITEALTAELSRQLPHGLDVLAPLSARAYGREAREIGRGVKATYVLSGDAEPSRQGLHLAARLARTEDGKELWRESFDVDLEDAPLVYERIADGVARALRLPPRARRPERRPKPSVPAYEAYLRGLYLLGNERYEEAKAKLQDAVLLDPDFAPGYAHLALTRLQTSSVVAPDIEATEAVARRALALDPNLAEAHVALGILLFQYRVDWEGAGRELRKALALNPGSADAHHEYSLYLSALGRHAEGIASAGRARELNPASMRIGSNYAWYFYMDHRYEEAIRQARSILELYPLSESTVPREAGMGRYMCQNTILLSAWKLGDRETALGAAREISRILGSPWAESPVGDVDEFWRQREQRIQDLLRKGPVDTYSQAKNAMLIGQRERALDLLTRQCDSPGIRLPFAAIEPLFDDLHGDPRWPQVLDCLRLPADAPARRPAR